VAMGYVAALLEQPRLLDYQVIAIAGIESDVSYHVFTRREPRKLGTNIYNRRGTKLLEIALLDAIDTGRIAYQKTERGRYSFKTRDALAWLVTTVPIVNDKLKELNRDVTGNEDPEIPAVGAVRGGWEPLSKSEGKVSAPRRPAMDVEPPRIREDRLRILPIVTKYLKKTMSEPANASVVTDTRDYMTDLPHLSEKQWTILSVLLRGNCVNKARGKSYVQIAAEAEGIDCDPGEYQKAGVLLRDLGYIVTGRGPKARHYLTESGVAAANRYMAEINR
jgi:hypothetical protein